MQILVLTNTVDYGVGATLYPLLRALSARHEVTRVYVADAAFSQNHGFYEGRDRDVRHVYARRVDSAVCFENQSAYAPEYVDLDGIDAVWLRLDLADELFLQYVEQRFAGRFISNSPAGVVRSGTKAFLLGLAPVMDDLMPAVKLCYSASNVARFRKACPDIVLKVLRSFGGQGVVRVRENGLSDLNGKAEIASFLKENGPCLAMAYLDNPAQSDNRICVLNGEILGVIRRVPRPGDWICNLMAGGSFEACAPDEREIEIIRRLHPVMEELGVHYYGVDTLLNAKNERVLSEINTINAGGAYRYEQRTGRPVCRMIADDFVSRAVAARSYSLPAAPAGGPGPLKVISAEPAGDIDRFADEIKTGHIVDFERF